jgi:hypothetical protein
MPKIAQLAYCQFPHLLCAHAPTQAQDNASTAFGKSIFGKQLNPSVPLIEQRLFLTNSTKLHSVEDLLRSRGIVIILLLVALVLMPVGAVLVLMGMWDRTPDAPSVSGGSLRRMLVPPWKQRSWFKTPQAYRKYIWGNLLWSVSFGLNFLYFLTRLIQEGWR